MNTSENEKKGGPFLNDVPWYVITEEDFPHIMKKAREAVSADPDYFGRRSYPWYFVYKDSWIKVIKQKKDQFTVNKFTGHQFIGEFTARFKYPI